MDPVVVSRPLPSRREAILACLLVATTSIMGVLLLGAAALVPAPAAVLPFVIIVCLGCPMVAVYDLSPALAVLRRGRVTVRALDDRACKALRREIAALPETRHPLDL